MNDNNAELLTVFGHTNLSDFRSSQIGIDSDEEIPDDNLFITDCESKRARHVLRQCKHILSKWEEILSIA